MVYENELFRVQQGDDEPLEIPIYEADGSLADLTGAALRFTFGPSETKALVTKTGGSEGVSVGPPAGGGSGTVVIVALRSDETALLKPYTRYFYTCRVTMSDQRETVAKGEFIVDPEQR